MKPRTLTLLLIILTIQLFGKGIEPISKDIKTPPRIIRACCAFGYKIGYAGLPFLTHSDIADPNSVGDHKFMGGRKEGNGILYTYRGGFIDLGHLRDQADWTAFIYHLINEHKENDTITIRLAYEGGPKHLKIFPPNDISDNDAVSLAARIAYDLSVWHEIATWFGTSAVPLIPERYSSFSIEDNYSNLMGVTLGMWALRSPLPYNEAMTLALKNTLDSLKVVSDPNLTYEAMDRVYNAWWTRSYRFPYASVMQKRELYPYSPGVPLLVPGMETNTGFCELPVPSVTQNGTLLTSFYSLELRLNGKFPVKELFPEHQRHIINQNDFQKLMSLVLADVAQRVKPPKMKKKEMRKNK